MCTRPNSFVRQLQHMEQKWRGLKSLNSNNAHYGIGLNYKMYVNRIYYRNKVELQAPKLPSYSINCIKPCVIRMWKKYTNIWNFLSMSPFCYICNLFFNICSFPCRIVCICMKSYVICTHTLANIYSFS